MGMGGRCMTNKAKTTFVYFRKGATTEIAQPIKQRRRREVLMPFGDHLLFTIGVDRLDSDVRFRDGFTMRGV